MADIIDFPGAPGVGKSRRSSTNASMMTSLSPCRESPHRDI